MVITSVLRKISFFSQTFAPLHRRTTPRGSSRHHMSAPASSSAKSDEDDAAATARRSFAGELVYVSFARSTGLSSQHGMTMVFAIQHTCKLFEFA